MRSFQFIFVFIFLCIYGIFSFGAFKNIKSVINAKFYPSFKKIILFQSLFFILTFIILYIYPFQPIKVKSYNFYLIFNIVLILDFTVKLILSITFLIHLILEQRKNQTVILWIGVILSTSVSIIVFYGSIQGKNDLEINKIELEYKNLPFGFDNYKIVQFSDLHLGSFFKSQNLINKVEFEIKKINPDLILFTGDLVNNFKNETRGWENLFNQINKAGNSYSILGNHDYGNYTTWKSAKAKKENFEAIIDAQKTLGFQLLRNENVTIKSGNDSIYLAGVENWGHPPFPQYADLNKALQNVPENAFIILMSHDPAHWESQIKEMEKIELTLSGHTHGLQWGIKLGGIPFSLAYLTRKNWAGLYHWNHSILYVNEGLGVVGIPWRIDMPAELTVITLKRIKIN